MDIFCKLDIFCSYVLHTHMDSWPTWNGDRDSSAPGGFSSLRAQCDMDVLQVPSDAGDSQALRLGRNQGAGHHGSPDGCRFAYVCSL